MVRSRFFDLSGFFLGLATSTACLATPALAAPPPLDAYGDLPGVVDMAVSPDGTRRASIRNIDGELHVFVHDLDGNLVARSSAGTQKVRGITWADDKTLLITTTATVSLGPYFTASKYELTGTHLISIDNSGASGLIFGHSRNVANMTSGSYGLRHLDGKTIGYFGGIEFDTSSFGQVHWKSGRTTLYAVDLAKNSPHKVAHQPGEGHYRDWLIDAAGDVAITLDVNKDNGDWTIFNARNATLARGNDPTGGASLVSFGQDGTSVIYAMEDENGVSRWFEVPLTGGAPIEFLPHVDVERLYIDSETSRVMGYRKKGETPETVMYDPVLQKKLAMIFRAFPGRNVRLMDWTDGFDQVILRTDGNQDSGTWFFVDVPGRRADPIGDERARVMPEDVGPISAFDYTAQDGLKLDGVLTLPPGRNAHDLPLVMLPHGGPHSSDEVGFDWWAQAFASRGYAVFQPNFRGSTGRGDALREAGYGQWGRKMQTDISDALEALASKGIVDRKRACIVGASYGGYAALAGVTLQHGLYRCAVSVAGVADIGLMYRTDLTESGKSPMTRAWLREDLGDPKGYDAISPRDFASTADAPILLVHGKDDTVVPFKQSAVMADALKDAGKPYEMVVLKEEDHWLSRAETRKEMLEAVVGFVEKNNPAD